MTPQRPEQRSEVPEHRRPQRKKNCGWWLWWYASSFKSPRSPAGASHSIHREVNNHLSVPRSVTTQRTCVIWMFASTDSELRTECKVATFSSSFQQEVYVILVDLRPEWSRGDSGDLLRLAEASGAATPGYFAIRPLVALLQPTLISEYLLVVAVGTLSFWVASQGVVSHPPWSLGRF